MRNSTQLLQLTRRLILFSTFILTSIFASADWKGYFDNSDIIALVECSRISQNSEKITILECYKGDVKIGDELKLTSYFRNNVGTFGRSRILIFAKKKAGSSSQIIYDVDAALILKLNGIACNLYDSEPNENTPITSFRAFDSFLEAYRDSSLRPRVCQKIIQKLKNSTNTRRITLYLMELYILGLDQYDPVFRDILKFDNSSVQYALIHVMGNIRTDESRSVLASILSSEKMWLVGMTIQMLANETPEAAGPILLKQFNIWSDEYLENKRYNNKKYDNSIDWGVYDGFFSSFEDQTEIRQEKYQESKGKWEIIIAFGKLQYKPAGPALIEYLDKCDRYEYAEVMDVIQLLGNQDYSGHFNKLLDNNQDENINWIVKKIIEDSIVKCLPSLRSYVSRLDRKAKCNSFFLVSADSGLGAFSDSLTRNFLLQDFERFMKKGARLKCDKIHVWNAQYIKSFSANKEERARPLINRLFFETFGINEDFGSYPELFRIKQKLETSAVTTFQKKLDSNGYKWLSIKRCVAIIENTKEVMQGMSPKVHYAVECEVTKEYNSIDPKNAAVLYTEIIQKELGVAQDSISIIIGNYIYTDYALPTYIWIDSHPWEKPLLSLYSSYFIENPTEASTRLFKGILDYKYVTRDHEIEALNQTILEMKTRLSDRDNRTN